jgi:hypothetical protein
MDKSHIDRLGFRVRSSPTAFQICGICWELSFWCLVSNCITTRLLRACTTHTYACPSSCIIRLKIYDRSPLGGYVLPGRSVGTGCPRPSPSLQTRRRVQVNICWIICRGLAAEIHPGKDRRIEGTSDLSLLDIYISPFPPPRAQWPIRFS